MAGETMMMIKMLLLPCAALFDHASLLYSNAVQHDLGSMPYCSAMFPACEALLSIKVTCQTCGRLLISNLTLS